MDEDGGGGVHRWCHRAPKTLCYRRGTEGRGGGGGANEVHHGECSRTRLQEYF